MTDVSEAFDHNARFRNSSKLDALNAPFKSALDEMSSDSDVHFMGRYGNPKKEPERKTMVDYMSEDSVDDHPYVTPGGPPQGGFGWNDPPQKKKVSFASSVRSNASAKGSSILPGSHIIPEKTLPKKSLNLIPIIPTKPKEKLKSILDEESSIDSSMGGYL